MPLSIAPKRFSFFAFTVTVAIIEATIPIPARAKGRTIPAPPTNANPITIAAIMAST